MAFSRTNRIDRRRRVMLDAVATDAEYAVESVRAKKRMRARELEESDDDYSGTVKYRDPGYSQAVRRACQQRMVQLIPVRRGTLTLVLSCMWTLWAALVFSHYWLHLPATLAASDSATNGATTAAAAQASTFKLPIVELFNLRSSHSIAHWLTCQLWMLTALAAWMIFQLRRHKLDDYRARYRIWAVLAVVALFSSFDASSSFLGLLGMSIDKWTRSEIGYGGWPLVLATFASLVGVLGIRLCSELKSAPGSVACWMIGLLAWAASAVLGTGLFKTPWEPATVDLVVGACWLGGVLAVFQSAGIYLRQTYIRAQKRFLERSGANLQPIRLKAPSFTLPFKSKGKAQEKEYEDSNSKEHRGRDKDLDLDTPRRGWSMPWTRKSDPISSEDRDVEQSGKNKNQKNGQVAEHEPELTKSNKPKARLFGIVPHRSEQNERLEAEPIREDDGPEVDMGLTKTRGWFGIGGNKNGQATSKANTSTKVETKSSDRVANTVAETRGTSSQNAEGEAKEKKPSLWSKMRRQPRVAASPDTKSEQDLSKTKRGWIPKIGRSKTNADGEKVPVKKPVEPKAAKAPKDPSQKSSWFGARKEKSNATSTTTSTSPSQPAAVQKTAAPAADKPGKRGLFGMFDGLKLKPPGENETNRSPSDAKGPSASGPVPVKQGQPLPSTKVVDNDDDDEDDMNNGRPLSKADRKRLRRQQDDRRAA